MQVSVTGTDYAIHGDLEQHLIFLGGQTQDAWHTRQGAGEPAAPEEDQLFVQSSWCEEPTWPVDGIFHNRLFFKDVFWQKPTGLNVTFLHQLELFATVWRYVGRWRTAWIQSSSLFFFNLLMPTCFPQSGCHLTMKFCGHKQWKFQP